MKKVDMHMHSTWSDGSDTVSELLDKVLEAGIQKFSLTDHDTYAGVEEMQELMKEREISGLEFIPGIELSCLLDTSDTNSDCHILGYGYNPNHPEIIGICRKSQEYRKEKLIATVEFLKEKGYDITDEELESLSGIPSVGKPHIVELLVIKNHPENIRAYRNRLFIILDELKTAYHVSAQEAIRAIRDANGMAVWAHPLGDKEDYKTHKNIVEFYNFYRPLKEYGIQGLECEYSRYTDEEIDFLKSVAQKDNILMSSGSDYHGKRKNIMIGQLKACH